MSETLKTKADRSQSQVLIYCSSAEEAEKLHKAVQTYSVDTIDDALNSHQALEMELKAMQDDRVNLLAKNEALQAEVDALKKVVSKPKQKSAEKVLGGNKNKKSQKKS